MQEVFEKIINAFENIHRVVKNDEDQEWNRAVWKCTEIINQVAAEHNNGWIPCSERLPERDGAYQLKEFEVTVDNGERIYTSHATYDFHNEKWLVHKKKVIAWKQPCEPYQPKGE